MPPELFYVLLAYTVVRELWFHYTTHKLLNKLMSRSYFDFQTAEKQTKLSQAVKPRKPHPDFDAPDEDLGTLQGLG